MYMLVAYKPGNIFKTDQQNQSLFLQDIDVEKMDSNRSRSHSPADGKRKKMADSPADDVLDDAELTELRQKRQVNLALISMLLLFKRL